MRKLILILWLAVTPAWAAPPRTLTANIPITGINRLVVTTTAGAVHITASPDNAIHVQVTLHQTEHRLLWFFHWMRAGTAGDMEAAVLDREKQGGTLVLSLEYPAGDVRSDVHQQWLVQVPAQLALAADMDTGQLAIDGDRKSVV